MMAQVERSGRPADEGVKAQVVQHLLDLETFLQAAEKAGVKASKGYEQKATVALQQVMAGLMMADYQKKVKVSDAEAKAEYDQFVASLAGQQVAPFDQVKPQIVQHLAQQKVAKFQQDLLSKARIQ
jgi:peptidyl-prolyl cis-trans isomerase C